jgi:hypothetical protein
VSDIETRVALAVLGPVRFDSTGDGAIVFDPADTATVIDNLRATAKALHRALTPMEKEQIGEFPRG